MMEIDKILLDFLNHLKEEKDIFKLNIDYSKQPYNDIIDRLFIHFHGWKMQKWDIYLSLRNFVIDYNRELVEQISFNNFYDSVLAFQFKALYNALISKLEFTAHKQEVYDLFLFLEKSCFGYLRKEIDNPEIKIINQRLLDGEKAVQNLNNNVKQISDSINEDFDKLRIQVAESKKEVDEQSKKLAESSITILGIFVGIAMVFFGGFSILDNTIETLSQVSPYRLYFTMIAFGAIMYNIIVLLFFLIGRITKKHITCKCYRDDKNVSSKECMSCSERNYLKGICRIKKTLPYIYWGNLFMFAAMVFIFSLKYLSSPQNPLNLGLKQIAISSLISVMIIVCGFLTCTSISDKFIDLFFFRKSHRFKKKQAKSQSSNNQNTPNSST